MNNSDDLKLIAGDIRHTILLEIEKQKKVKMSDFAEKINEKLPYISKNFKLLRDAQIIEKDTDSYFLTTFGKAIVIQIKSIDFVSKNKKYFNEHTIDDLPFVFKSSIGSLMFGTLINGFVKVESQWNLIHTNAEKYVKNILIEVPYSKNLMETIAKQSKKGVEFASVFSDKAIIPTEREEIKSKLKLDKLIKENKLKRVVKKNVKVAINLNEKEALVIFPTKDDSQTDFSKAFYSNDPIFHEWCLEYFRYCWESSDPFQENKLKNCDKCD